MQGQNLLFSIKLQDLLWTRGRSKERMNFFSTAVYKKRKAHGQTALNKKETAKSSLLPSAPSFPSASPPVSFYMGVSFPQYVLCLTPWTIEVPISPGPGAHDVTFVPVLIPMFLPVCKNILVSSGVWVRPGLDTSSSPWRSWAD